MYFSKDARPKVLAEGRTTAQGEPISTGEVGRIVAEMWKTAPPADAASQPETGTQASPVGQGPATIRLGHEEG